jgi:L-asparaginase II
MINPVIAEVTRGGIVESRHRGAFIICDTEGNVNLSAGDMAKPIFPRSAIKAFQCMPIIESGAADRFNLTDEEIALCCASHNGEPEHVRVARSILKKCGAPETDLECGAHAPSARKAFVELIRAGTEPSAIHNNCSGKHSGMLALAEHLGVPHFGYTAIDHVVQKSVASTIERLCGVDLGTAAIGIDGCSVPNWAIPLRQLAIGFARLAQADCASGQRIVAAVRAHPFLIAGTNHFDTKVMQEVPRLFIKVGAEGVYCGCIPHAGLGFALKIDDGASRGAQVAIASALSKLDCWTESERQALQLHAVETLSNWRRIEVGEIRAAGI